MKKVKLLALAIARSGDKGDGSNIGVMARSDDIYTYLAEHLTADVVKDFFKEICFGEVIRYELPNLNSLNFILHNSLDGGGTETMITDAQGKCHGTGLLHLEIDVPAALLDTIKR